MLTVAAAPLRIPNALTMGGGMRSWGWLMRKFSSERSVCAPQYLSPGTWISPKASLSVRVVAGAMMRAVLWKPLLRLPVMMMVELDDEEPRRRRCCCCGVRPHVVVVVAAKTPAARDDDQVAAAALLAAVLGMHAAPAALLAVTVRNILAFPSALRSLRLAEFDTVWAICSRGPIGVLLSWERGAARAAAFLTCVIFFFLSHTSLRPAAQFPPQRKRVGTQNSLGGGRTRLFFGSRCTGAFCRPWHRKATDYPG